MNETEFGNKHKVTIKSYRFIYPTLAKYRALNEVRLYALPAALKDSWLSFNPAVLAEIFSIFPGANTSRSILQGEHSKKKTKTILLGIPKQLAHKDPVGTFRNRSLNRGFSISKFGNIQNNQGKVLQEMDKFQINNTIIPKGTKRKITKVPSESQLLHDDQSKEEDEKEILRGPTLNGTSPKEIKIHVSQSESSGPSPMNAMESSIEEEADEESSYSKSSREYSG